MGSPGGSGGSGGGGPGGNESPGSAATGHGSGGGSGSRDAHSGGAGSGGIIYLRASPTAKFSVSPGTNTVSTTPTYKLATFTVTGNLTVGVD